MSLDVLRSVYRMAQAADNASDHDLKTQRMKDAREAFANLFTKEALYALAHSDRDKVTHGLELLSSMAGWSGRVGRLSTEFRKKCKLVDTQLRLVEENEQKEEQQVQGIDIGPGAPELPEGSAVPAGWLLDASGIMAEKPTEPGVYWRVSGSPLVITEILETVDDSGDRARAVWRTVSGKWKERVMPLSILRDSRRIIALADDGLDIGSDSARVLVQWVGAWIRRNAQVIPASGSSSRCGWIHDRLGKPQPSLGYVVPGTTPIVLDARDGLEEVSRAMQPCGTLDDWKRAIEPAMRFPSVAVLLYASLAAPLVAPVKASNLVVDVSGQTSSGKTTALSVPASVWGRPKKGSGYVRGWAQTRASLEALTSLLWDVPAILDDTKDAARPEIVAEALYPYSSGEWASRGQADGGMRKTRHTRGVMISSGEAPITSYSPNAGVRTRVLCMTNCPWGGTVDASMLLRLVADLDDCYGTAGRAIFEWLSDANWGELRKRYVGDMELWTKRIGGDRIASRLAGHLSLLCGGRALAQVVLGLDEPDGVDEVLEFMARNALSESDRPAAALTDAYAWAASRSGSWWGRHATDRGGDVIIPHSGWHGRWFPDDGTEICWIPKVLEKVLLDLGYPPKEIVAAWVDRGWVDIGSHRHRTKVRKLGSSGERVRMLVVRHIVEYTD